MDAKQTEVLGRVGRWARNAGYDLGDQSDRMSVVVSETGDVVDWLTDPRAGILREDTLVLVRDARRSRPLPQRPGTWLRYSGALAEPGDEIQLGEEFWLQMTDYASLRYLSITGP